MNLSDEVIQAAAPSGSLLVLAAGFPPAERPAKAADAAAKKWDGFNYKERDQAAVARVFGERPALEPEFSIFDDGRPMAAGDFGQLSLRVFGPLLEHLP